MSQTFNLACKQCRKALWIGQRRMTEGRGFIYTTPKHSAALSNFLFDHAGHPLVFDEVQKIDHEYEDVTPKDDDG